MAARRRILREGSGAPAGESQGRLRTVRALELGVPVYVGSGVTEQSLDLYLREADGVIVGSAIMQGGRAGAPLDAERARRFVATARKILD